MGSVTFLVVLALLVVPVVAFLMIYRLRKPEEIVKEYAGTPEDKSLFIKKYEKADVNNQRNLFMEVGLTVALAIVLLAFAYAPKEDDTSSLMSSEVIEEEIEEIPQTNQAKPPPPPPPPPPEVIEVEDDIEIEDQPDLFDQELDIEDVIESPAYVPAAPVIKEEPKEPEIFVVVEQMPEFPGGDKALYEFLAKNIKYPAVAKDNGIEGKVYIKFVINEDGSVSQATVARGIGGGCDEEALRVVKDMPKWKPGKQRGKNVKVWYTLPVYFKLQ
jgi:periplasmic protein TonB